MSEEVLSRSGRRSPPCLPSRVPGRETYDERRGHAWAAWVWCATRCEDKEAYACQMQVRINNMELWYVREADADTNPGTHS